MNIFYSPSAHATGNSSGFYIANYPSDAFLVSDADHRTALSLPAGSTYDFSPPVAPNITGVLSTTQPTSTYLLLRAQSIQLQVLSTAYASAVMEPISYTSKGGITKTYQADTVSVNNLQSLLTGLAPSQQSLPSDFYWVSLDNTQVPFTYVDLEQLGVAMCAQGIVAFAHLQTKKAAINAATTVAAVQAIVW